MNNSKSANDIVIKNKLGYYTLKNIPSKKELKEYYQKKYYQAEEKYSSKYTKDELKNITGKLDLKYEIVKKYIYPKPKNGYSLLDIGAGEGWTLKFFKEKGWRVKGIDFSDFGCKSHNPGVLNDLTTGDLDEAVNKLMRKGEKFDLLWLDNVLEHVEDPQILLSNCKNLANKNSLLIIEVPNDFSPTQKHLLENGYISYQYWITTPDHISYFNRKSLNNLCRSHGWESLDLLADFPIDFFLFNSHTNYIANKKIGKECHIARVRIENFINSLPEGRSSNIYRSLAQSGLGRQIIGFYKLK